MMRRAGRRRAGAAGAIAFAPALAAPVLALAAPALAAPAPTPSSLAANALSPRTVTTLLSSPELTLVAIVAGVVLLPGVLLLMTSFTRIAVVLSLARTAVGTAQTPPNQVIIALALILTAYSMAPTLSAVNRQAIAPYMAGRLNVVQALDAAEGPVKEFMAAGTREQDLVTLMRAANEPTPRSLAQVPLLTLIPAFAVSQLTLAFQMGFLLFLPFLLIDFLVSSVLMSLGMMMLPPTVVSLPFKLLLFVLVNGWGLLVGTLVATSH
jgi:flagellar biosynthetic protein FliP